MKSLAMGLILLFASSLARAAQAVPATGNSAGTSSLRRCGRFGGHADGDYRRRDYGGGRRGSGALASSSGGANPTVAHGGSTPGSYPTAARILCTRTLSGKPLFQENGLDVIAIRINQKCCVIIGAVVEPQAGQAVVATPGPQAFCMEAIHRDTLLRSNDVAQRRKRGGHRIQSEKPGSRRALLWWSYICALLRLQGNHAGRLR